MTNINKSLFIELNGWIIYVKNEDGSLITSIAIPPTSKNRIDVFIQKEIEFLHYENYYIYNFKGNLNKLKGEKIIIKINNSKPLIEYKK
ncbi:hypothetical protein M0Q50_09965 [bacterium]|jgi:hypothetical protein|nr:hypothetical protein [bacterium]